MNEAINRCMKLLLALPLIVVAGVYDLESLLVATAIFLFWPTRISPPRSARY